MALASPDRRALKAELKILGWPEADLLDMDPWIAWIDYVGQIRSKPPGFDGLGI